MEWELVSCKGLSVKDARQRTSGSVRHRHETWNRFLIDASCHLLNMRPRHDICCHEAVGDLNTAIPTLNNREHELQNKT